MTDKLQKVKEDLEWIQKRSYQGFEAVPADVREKVEEALAELKEFMEGEGWKDFNWKDSKGLKNLKGKYLCETVSGNIWVAELNKDSTGYPHKCSCGMNAAMSMHFTKYRSLPERLEQQST